MPRERITTDRGHAFELQWSRGGGVVGLVFEPAGGEPTTYLFTEPDSLGALLTAGRRAKRHAFERAGGFNVQNTFNVQDTGAPSARDAVTKYNQMLSRIGIV